MKLLFVVLTLTTSSMVSALTPLELHQYVCNYPDAINQNQLDSISLYAPSSTAALAGCRAYCMSEFARQVTDDPCDFCLDAVGWVSGCYMACHQQHKGSAELCGTATSGG